MNQKYCIDINVYPSQYLSDNTKRLYYIFITGEYKKYSIYKILKKIV